MSPQTQKVLDFLSSPSSYPHKPEKVTLVQTHASWVFIASPLVFKIKKPVQLGFLDFSTLELRHEDCEREVKLNRRLADEIYLEVTKVTENEGALGFGGEGEVLEWVVKMRELDERFLLLHLLKHSTVGIGDFDRVVTKLHQFYDAQPLPPQAEQDTAIDRLRMSTDGNFKVAQEFIGQSLTQIAFDAITSFTNAFYEEQRPLLESRIRGGWIRDCHGDLHLEHIHITPDAVNIYDCIEFNTRFRYIDVACDLAFLAMDLEFNGRADLAQHLVDRFEALLKDDDMRKLMDFYKCYRACVRGKVASLTSKAEGLTPDERAAKLALANRYYGLALRYAIAGSAPHAFVFMGRIASGKSSLAKDFSAETGWTVLSSDQLRKELAGVDLHTRGSEEERAVLYAPGMTKRTYDAMFDAGIAALRAGNNVIFDATFSSREHRDALRQHLQEAGFGCTWVAAHASDDVTRERLARRAQSADVVSDARLEDFEKLTSRFEAPEELPDEIAIRISTEGSREATLHLLMQQLAERGVRRVM
jgi:uncharacterized protein